MTYTAAAHRRAVNSFFDWLSGFDTRIVEFGCALRLLVLAWNVVSYDETGKSTAPFLSFTLFSFDGGASLVLFALAFVGLWQLLALAKDTLPKRNGLPEQFLHRFFATVTATACCAFLVFAMIGLGNPVAVVLTYSLSLLLNLFDAAVLWVKHEDCKNNVKGDA